MENPRPSRGRRKPVPAFLRPRKRLPKVERSIPPAKGGKIGSFFEQAEKPVLKKQKPAVRGGKLKAMLRRKPAPAPVRRKPAPAPVRRKPAPAPVRRKPAPAPARRKPAQKSLRPVSLPTRRKGARKPAKVVTPRRTRVRVLRTATAGIGAAGIARRQAIAAYRRALRTFRPKKAERGTVVFLAARPRAGKSERLGKGSRRLGYAVYVTSTGKVRPLRDSRVPRGKRGVPKAQRRGSLDPRGGRTAKERRAIEQVMFKRIRTRRGLTRLVVPAKGQTSVDWPKVKRMMTRAMSIALAQTMEAHTQIVTSSVVVKGHGVFEARTYLNVSAEQARMKPGMEWDAFQAKADEQYGIIAEQLVQSGANGLVSRGSAKFIASLSGNEDLDQEDWTDESGERWEKNECEIVDIASWTFEIGVGQVSSEEE